MTAPRRYYLRTDSDLKAVLRKLDEVGVSDDAPPMIEITEGVQKASDRQIGLLFADIYPAYAEKVGESQGAARRYLLGEYFNVRIGSLGGDAQPYTVEEQGLTGAEISGFIAWCQSEIDS